MVGLQSATDWDPGAYELGSTVQTDEGRRLVDQLGPLDGRSVVDVGCGDGRLTLALRQAGARVLGVDPVLVMVRRASDRGVRAVVGRAEALPLTSGGWDLVFSNAALHWSLDHQRAAGELVRVLRPGGRLQLRLGGPGNQWGTFLEAERLFTEPPFSAHRPPGFVAPLRMADPSEWFVALTEAGMNVHTLGVEAVEPPWAEPADMARWFLPIAHPYTRRLPHELRREFVTEVVRRVWLRDPSARAFVRLVVDASKEGPHRAARRGPAPPA